MKTRHEKQVQYIPIDSITVVNPRSRGQTRFKQIVSNISNIGLKKPITVVRRSSAGGMTTYDLVCGQGRLEAFQALGQTEVPAMVIDADREELMLMSLAENLARRQRTSVEMAKEIVAQHDRGDSIAEISRKVDLDKTYVRGIIKLLKHGEERLLRAVEQRTIPLSMAIEIAEADDQEVQRILTDAYQAKELRGQALLTARKLLDKRKNKGKSMYTRGKQAGESQGSASLVKVYKHETARLQGLVKRANDAETRMAFLTTAFKKLLADPSFVSLLRAESLGSLPQLLTDTKQKGPAHAR